MGKDDKILENQELLSAYLDGEISELEGERLAELLATDPELTRELEEQKVVGDEIRSLFSDACLDDKGRARDLDLWGRVAEGISAAGVAGESAELGRDSHPDGLLIRLKNYLGLNQDKSSSGSLFGLPQLSGAFAAVLLLFLYFGQKQELSAPGLSSNKFTGRAPVIDSTALDQSVLARKKLREKQAQQIELAKRQSRLSNDGQLIPNVSGLDRVGSAKEARVPRVQMASNRALKKRGRDLLLSPRRPSSDLSRKPSRFERSVELVLGDEQWIGSESIPGGLRAGGVDIDWVKTDRPFKILTPNGQDSPVIWIGRNRFNER